MVFRAFREHDYEVVPVRPDGDEIEGLTVYPRVQEIPDGVDAAYIITAPEVTEKIVRDCAEADIKRVWIHRGAGRGSVSAEAVEFCREHDIDVIPGQCPLMFLGKPAWYHRMHGFFKKLGGTYPRA